MKQPAIAAAEFFWLHLSGITALIAISTTTFVPAVPTQRQNAGFVGFP